MPGSPARPETSAGRSPALRLHWAEPEAARRRWVYLSLALLVVAGFVYANWCYWVPAHGGVDQNGYMVGGRRVAECGSPRLDGRNPDTGRVDAMQFVGNMWVGAELGTDGERYYPKYPIGLPALVAGTLKLGAWLDHKCGYSMPTWGPWLAYWISPACMAASILATFLMVRLAASSFAALLATLVVAASPVTLGLSNNPNSHASTLACVTWGMYLLLRWWREGGAFKGSIGAFLVGFATTIRYTEALLALPVGLVVVFRVASAWRVKYRSNGVTECRGAHPVTPSPRHPVTSAHPVTSSLLDTLIQSTLILAWWSLPVLALAVFNLRAMGTLTGYDPTNESVGFGWEYFTENWPKVLHQLNDTGMTFVFPLAVAGMVWMFWWNWKLATVIVSWTLPSAVVYAFYYWAPDRPPIDNIFNNVAAIGYLRFFLTIVPPLAMSAYWLVSRLGWTEKAHTTRWLGTGASLGAGIITMAAIALSLRLTRPSLDADHIGRLMLDVKSQEIASAVHRALAAQGLQNKDAVVFCRDASLMHHLQFITSHRYYSPAMFEVKSVESLLTVDPNEPQGLDPNRRMNLAKRMDLLLSDKVGIPVERLDESVRGEHLRNVLMEEEQKIIEAALKARRGVFIVIQGRTAALESMEGLYKAPNMDRMLDPNRFVVHVVDTWAIVPPALEKPGATKKAARALPLPGRPVPRPDYSSAWIQVLQVKLRAPEQRLPTTVPWPMPEGAGKSFKPVPPKAVKPDKPLDRPVKARPISRPSRAATTRASRGQ